MKNNPFYEGNPYNPAFGTPPRSYIHRYQEETRILNDFCAKDADPLSYMILGVRGTGKTVLLHEMANTFESFAEWTVVRINPNTDMMDSLLKKLSYHRKIASIIQSAKINLSFFNLSVETPTSPIKDTEDAITEILKEMKKNDRRLLIIVDEATNTASMKTFASAYQNFIGQKLPVFMLMTGLYDNINSLKDEDNLTFLYRMPCLNLTSLKLSDIVGNYKDVFMMDNRDALGMAEFTRGYSYAFQLLGKLTWDNGGDYTAVLGEFRSALYDMVYEKIWSELSEKDQDLTYGISKSVTGSINEIKDILGWKTNEIFPYKNRLTKKGLICSPKYGYIDMTLPYFKDFTLDNYMDSMLSYKLPSDR